MLTKSFIEFLYDAEHIQRWNEHIRPSGFTELDKQAHKMMIMYVLARHEEDDHAEAAQLARQEWNSARMCDANHPYLRRKGIPALEGIRQSRDGSLLIPVMDAANNLQSLQRVYPDGTKRFLVGGKVSGGQFIIQGQPEKPVAVCEGFATGTSIHIATGWTVYVAFSANNLARVAKTVKERLPDKTIIICGDNDEADRKSTRLNSSHITRSRMPSSA